MAGVRLWLTQRKRQAIIACVAFAALTAWGVGVRGGVIGGSLSHLRPDGGASANAGAETTPAAYPDEAASTETPAVQTIAPLPTATEVRAMETRPLAVASATRPRLTPAVSPPTATPVATATQEPPPTPVPSQARKLTPPAGSDRSLRVDQDKQEMLVYEGDEIVRVIAVSTGAPFENSFTPSWSGVVGSFWGRAQFRDTELWADYIWYLFPGAAGSILIHSVPYANDGEEKIYDRPEALGVEPASKGCVRISPEDAEWLSGWDPVGVPIEITRYSGVIKPVPDAP